MRFLRLALVGLVGACGGPSAPAPLADSCRVQLGPAAPPVAPLSAAPIPTPPSRAIAHVAVRLAKVKTELEKKIPMRLAEERGRSIGVAGRLNYVVDRGPFTVSVDKDALIISTDVVARAEACAGKGCYASCEPRARAVATVPLRLLPDFRFAPSQVRATFVKGCEVRALGGMVRVDVTPTVEAQTRPALRRVEEEIDRQLPALGPEAQRLWAELGKPRALPFGGCAMIDPRGIVQGPIDGAGDKLTLRFALLAAPEVRGRACDPPAPPKPLPPLTHDLSMPADDDLVLGAISSIATVGGAVASVDPFDLGPGRARFGNVTAVASGPGVELGVELRGEVCGAAAASSKVAWSEDGKALRLADVTLAPAERDRQSRASLNEGAFKRALEAAKIPPLLAPSALRDLAPGLAEGLSSKSVAVEAKVAEASPGGAAVRGDDVVAWIKVRGHVEIRER